MKINLDLHIHSKYSAATSEKMSLSVIAREASKKGVKVVGTGDCLHPLWLDEIRTMEDAEGAFSKDGTSFLLSVEVEDASRVHHLILVPEISKALELREAFAPWSSNIDIDGRPNLRMNGAQIADIALEAGCIIGPSHSFTPWTGIFAHFRSLAECYGDRAGEVKFVELGLSADSDYADRISDLRSRTFLTNSDAHSPWSNKLAREFNQMEVQAVSFDEVRMAIARESGRRPTLNVGFYPEEGKYNRTACTRCYRQYSSMEMDDRLGHCSCGGSIKLGVRDRVEILADSPQPLHPDHRPPYLHLIPLAEIIAMALGHKSVFTSAVQSRWNDLVRGRSEIEVLVEADLSSLNTDSRTVRAIEAFRSGGVVVRPGGGGRYGKVELPEGLRPEGESAAGAEVPGAKVGTETSSGKARGMESGKTQQRSLLEF